jgi:hypothetical protein
MTKTSTGSKLQSSNNIDLGAVLTRASDTGSEQNLASNEVREPRPPDSLENFLLQDVKQEEAEILPATDQTSDSTDEFTILENSSNQELLDNGEQG